MASAYLITEEGWEPEDALARFTEVRMRPGFGEGVSIKSQLRWIKYITTWARELGKIYVEHAVEIEEIKIWGLRGKTAIAIEMFEDKGKVVKIAHTFDETEVVPFETSATGTPKSSGTPQTSATGTPRASNAAPVNSSTDSLPKRKSTEVEDPLRNVILRPKSQLIIPTNDVCVTFSSSIQLPFDFSLVTSIAYFWFNAYFHPDGVLSLEWKELDGLKGTYKKGLRTLDRVEIKFKAVGKETIVKEAEPGKADWKEQTGPASPGAQPQGVGENGGWIRRESNAGEGQALPHTFVSPPADHKTSPEHN